MISSKIDRQTGHNHSSHRMPRFSEIDDFNPDDWFDSSGSAASCLTPGYDIDSAIQRAARRVERKPRLDELDEGDQ